MTDKEIQVKIQKAIEDSKRYGICYILSNGQELQTAVTAELKESLKEKGYWVAAIYEHGYQIDLF